MTKLLRQVFGVWSSGQPFNPQHQVRRHETKTEASGLKDESSDGKEVTKAPACLEPVSAASDDCHTPEISEEVSRGPIDYTALRERVSFARVLDHLGQHVNGSQHRGPCPLHEPHAKQGHSFSVNLKRNAFRCFDNSCRAQGNVLDFWSAYRHLPLYEAAVDLARTLHIHLPTQQHQSSNAALKQDKYNGGHPPPSS